MLLRLTVRKDAPVSFTRFEVLVLMNAALWVGMFLGRLLGA